MNKIFRGFVKSLETLVCCGLAALGIAGIIKGAKNSVAAKKDVQEYINSEPVFERIADDLSVLNRKYDEGYLDYDLYRNEVKDLKNKAANEVYGNDPKYKKAVKDSKGNAAIFAYFVPITVGAIGAAFSFCYYRDTVTEYVVGSIKKKLKAKDKIDKEEESDDQDNEFN